MTLNGKILHLESHLSTIWFYRSNCYSENASKFRVMAPTNYWTRENISEIHNVMMDTQDVVGNFGEVLKNETSL